MIFQTILLILLLGSCYGIFEDCDFYQEIKSNYKYFVQSPGYPYRYLPGRSCRWYAVSPPNTKISLVCKEFYIPPVCTSWMMSQNCYYDKLSVSRSGRLDLADVVNFCGQKEIEITSYDNRMNIVLLTVGNSPGGWFSCEVTVVDVGPPSPRPECTCGYTNPTRIVGGSETGINEYPMMAGLVDLIHKEVICGGTIISQYHILTAAHCFVNVKTPRQIGILVGDHDISTGSDTDSAKVYLVESITKHSMYNTTDQRNDIALVKTQNPIEFSRAVGPACLPFTNVGKTFVGETVSALGWGVTSFGGSPSDKLLQVPLDVVDINSCKYNYRPGMVTEKHICTYGEDKDACQSDSGGPLLWRDPTVNAVKVLGIISYGIQCATDKPGVNTRVSSYLDWIKKTTGEDFCVV